ncbi:hypothetical protein PpBr36_02154 [Pyricularia pennisetigena]|uniref:hypothetical protein n=1 Tax=Pyricularia pennisetigena TaxID=1578925 RepID=UPI001150B6E6|nr:hypothetical protein PpBr36_02154 [Pyricularia pennisetigena]TLS29325.1 hypothetical protein PpBr36_02154 [Pyricularia pennisetigena]
MTAPMSDAPWGLLTSHFEFATSHPDHGDITNFYPRHKPDQGKDLNKFVELLAESLKTSAAQERAKYAESYDDPDPNDIVIPESDFVEIEVPFRRWHLSCTTVGTPYCLQNRVPPQHELMPLSVRRFKHAGVALPRSGDGGAVICTHVGDYNCRCLPRFEDRRMSTFLRTYQRNDCFEFDEVNGDSFYGLELLKALILHGNMETVLRICTHPQVDFLSWWDAQMCYCTGPDVALGQMCRDTLRAYIVLNLIQRGFPERCVRLSGEKAKSDEEERSDTSADYLRTRTYQSLVHDLTVSDTMTQIPLFQHMEFFGIRDDNFRTYPRKESQWKVQDDHFYPLGRVGYKEFIGLDFDTDPPYMPSAAEMETVRSVLSVKGLPTELVDMVLDLAEYDETRVLSIPHDPLHELNTDQLEEYLAWSWQTLLRFDMLARAEGDEMPWDMLIANCLLESFPMRTPTKNMKETTQCYTQIEQSDCDGLRFTERLKPVFL